MSSIDRYLPYINNAIAQRGQARANQFRQGGADISQLLQALSQIAQQNQIKTEADNFYQDTVTSTTPQANVTTDLLGKPLMQNKPVSFYPQGDPRNQTPNPVMGKTVTTSEQVDQSMNPAMLIRGLMSQNPEIARRAQAGIQGIQLQAPSYVTANAGDRLTNKNPFYTGSEQTINVPQKPTSTDDTVWEMEKNPDGSVKRYNFGSSIQSKSVKKVNGKVVEERYDPLGTTPQPTSSQSTEVDFKKWRGSDDYNTVIDAIGSGRTKIETALSGRLSSPILRGTLIADVIKKYPEYKQYTYENDKAFQRSYQPDGRIGLKVANLNTAVEHTGKLIELVDKLGNDNQQFVNSAKNWIAQTFGTQKAIPLNSFEAVKSALAGELGALFKGGNASATDTEIENISKVISSAQNPMALKGALVKFLEVGKDRIDMFAEPYNERFGENKDFLNSNPRKILRNMGVLKGADLYNKYGLEQ